MKLQSVTKRGSQCSTQQALGTLASCVDRDNGKENRFHMSASVYSCRLLENFASISGRPLFLQTLSPLSPVIDRGDVHLLPHLLQPFVDKTKMAKLPFKKNDKIFVPPGFSTSAFCSLQEAILDD
jgi:hypothetical protein